LEGFTRCPVGDFAWEKETTAGTEALPGHQTRSHTSIDSWESDVREESESRLESLHTEDDLIAVVSDIVHSSRYAVTLSRSQSDDIPLILAVSSAFEEMTGYDRVELEAKAPRFLTPEFDEEALEPIERSRLQHVEHTGEAAAAHQILRRKSGELLATVVYVKGIRTSTPCDSSKKSLLLLAVYMDLLADESGLELVDRVVATKQLEDILDALVFEVSESVKSR
jgi:PAS domain S-box-containing protein